MRFRVATSNVLASNDDRNDFIKTNEDVLGTSTILVIEARSGPLRGLGEGVRPRWNSRKAYSGILTRNTSKSTSHGHTCATLPVPGAAHALYGYLCPVKGSVFDSRGPKWKPKLPVPFTWPGYKRPRKFEAG